MKILFYPIINLDAIKNVAQYCDYMMDNCYHGFKSLFQDDLEEYIQLPHWYNDFENKIDLYGNGFTAFCLLDKNKTYNNIEQKIKDKYYDYIIVVIHNNMHNNSEIVKKIQSFNYNKNNIKIIDGNDDTSILPELTQYGTYFKRELTRDIDDILPINFSIDEAKILNTVPVKQKRYSHINPSLSGKRSYYYTNEKDYYAEYQSSNFAFTQKKGGWDCLRHYEIIMNGCIPIFINIEQCPNRTLYFWPKKELLAIEKYHNIIQNTEELALYFINLAKEKFTTKQVAKYVLEH